MTIKKILQYPHKNLRKIAQPVNQIDKKIKKIIYDMFETMYFNNGIGLAAPQININLQIITISPIYPNKKSLILINPKILKKKGKIISKEGCLSIPQKKEYIKRYNKISVKAINYYGKTIMLNTKELLSICIQHEIDHLIGKLFIDYLKKK